MDEGVAEVLDALRAVADRLDELVVARLLDVDNPAVERVRQRALARAQRALERAAAALEEAGEVGDGE